MRVIDTNALLRLLTPDNPKQVAAAPTQLPQQTLAGFWDLRDCLIEEIARRSGHLPIGTFDRDFSKLNQVEVL